MSCKLQMIKESHGFCIMIQVLSAESGCSRVFGYIPREVAEHLSKLMDTFGLTFQGHIMSVPEHSHAAVPIQISCQEKIFSELEGEKVQVYNSSCRQILTSISSSEAFPNGSIKYQQNFCMLLKEVLRTTPHVFTHDEKTFLENFLLLSNDSHKGSLFVCIHEKVHGFGCVISLMLKYWTTNKQLRSSLVMHIGFLKPIILNFADYLFFVVKQFFFSASVVYP